MNRSVFYIGARILLVAFALVALASPARSQQTTTAPLRTPDVIFVPTPHEVVKGMLQLAGVTKNDVVYDLGSGDGRIPIAAVRDFGAQRAVGIDIDPQRIKEATANLAEAEKQMPGISKRVRFLNQDLFTTDISDATVVTLYLLPSLNQKLIPKLDKELKAGSRVVSQSFDMGEWKPAKTIEVESRSVYLWTMPRK